jgi:hypothetical protein
MHRQQARNDEPPDKEHTATRAIGAAEFRRPGRSPVLGHGGCSNARLKRRFNPRLLPVAGQEQVRGQTARAHTNIQHAFRFQLI